MMTLLGEPVSDRRPATVVNHEDYRSLQEAQGDLDTLAEESDLQAVRARLDGLQEAVAEIETDMKSPPTSMDHMRVIGEIKADLRLLDQRLDWLEKR